MAVFAAKLYGAITTVVTTLLALKVDRLAASTEDNECELSSAQVSSIKATVALFYNSSCAYNMTVESILRALRTWLESCELL